VTKNIGKHRSLSSRLKNEIKRTDEIIITGDDNRPKVKSGSLKDISTAMESNHSILVAAGRDWLF